jgi:hypothetical protein
MNISFSLDSFSITETRSVHNDTDFASVSITVGTNPAITATKAMGDVNNGTHPVGLTVAADIPNDGTQVVLSYAIVNNGHTNSSTFETAISSALSALGAAGAKGGAAGLASLLGLGSVAVPVVGSALTVLAGWLVPKLIDVIFANCDGPVAIGVHIYTGQELLQSLSNGRKISEANVLHNGTNSATGCGANSVYRTTDTIAETIQTIIALNGQWAAGGVAGPVVSVTGNALSIDMSALKRPTATGTITDSSHISVNFPDDKSYTGTLEAPGTILWSNNSTWTNVAIQPEFDLNGQWAAGGVPGPVISVNGNALSIDMSALNRPTATGSITSSSTLTVNFPDDKTYTAKLEPPDVIEWSNNSSWKKVVGTVVNPLIEKVGVGVLHDSQAAAARGIGSRSATQ